MGSQNRSGSECLTRNRMVQALENKLADTSRSQKGFAQQLDTPITTPFHGLFDVHHPYPRNHMFFGVPYH